MRDEVTGLKRVKLSYSFIYSLSKFLLITCINSKKLSYKQSQVPALSCGEKGDTEALHCRVNGLRVRDKLCTAEWTGSV